MFFCEEVEKGNTVLNLNRVTVLYLLCIVLFVVMTVALLDIEFDLKLFVD